MMNNIAIKTENLGKRYSIKHENQESYDTFQDLLINSSRKIVTKLNPFQKSAPNNVEIEDFWALKNINFEINQGDKIGIIGRNGAGKSTLLKILSRITESTTGRLSIKGRVSSLLEVGTGFHPELTGRENIYLNGAILGMSRQEIKLKFDEIVDFSEVERFLDTPVKRYSSGMYVRLAFSVAAYLEPEILIIDEVLAVGDAEFQKKCLGRMNEASKQGKTIIFVSHNMGAISQLCSKGIMLDKGEMVFQGNVHDTINYYNDYNASDVNHYRFSRAHPEAYIEEMYIANKDEKIQNYFDLNEKICIHIIINLNKKILDPRIALTVSRNMTDIFHVGNLDDDKLIAEKKGRYKIIFTIPPMFIKEGNCSVSINLGTGHGVLYERKDHVMQFDIESTSVDTTKKGYSRNRPGSVIFPGSIDIEELKS